MSITTDQVKAFAVQEGADLVGIAPVKRWQRAPIEVSPQGILPTARSVIVIAVSLTDAGTELSGVDDPQKAVLGEVTGLAWLRLDHISFRIGKLLERHGGQAVPIVCTSLWRYRSYKGVDNGNVFLPDISHIHAGAAAGLGDIGYSGLLITPEYGPRVRLGSIITDVALEPDPLYDGPPLCDRCKMCVKVCRNDCAQALCKDVDGECTVQIENKVWKYAKINKWRCAWGEHFSLDLKEVPIPDHVSEHDVIKAMEHNDVKGWLNGRCQKFCLPPHLRKKDTAYCVPWRRKRQFGVLHEFPNHNRTITTAVKGLAINKGADLVKIISDADFQQITGLKLKNYLPDAATAILLGVDNVPGALSERETEVRYARTDYPHKEELQQNMQESYLPSDIAQQRIVFIGMDIAQHLERLGYSVLCCIQTLGIFADKITAFVDPQISRRFGLLITSVPLQSSTSPLPTFDDSSSCRASACQRPSDPVVPQADMPVWRKGTASRKREPYIGKRTFFDIQVERGGLVTPSFLSDKIKALAFQHGADLIGIASLSRLDELQPQLEIVAQSENQDYFTVLDVGRLSKGPFDPKVVPKTIKLKGPRDYLPDAKSVIVLGMHWFDAVLDRAGKPPAEAVGPYGFAQSETIRQLDDIALYVIKSLKAGGYAAAFSYDLHGLAGLVTGSCASGRSYYGMPWRGAGLYPDATANRFAAIAAGLGELGESGLVLTPEYGNRQRFVCIITDAELEATPLYDGPPLCGHCLKCIENCPVKAFGKEEITIKLEDKTFAYRACERLRCDWSKRYALIGAEGPQYIGSQTNILPPEKITPDNLCAALRQMDPLQKACMVIVEQCVAACPACMKINSTLNIMNRDKKQEKNLPRRHRVAEVA